MRAGRQLEGQSPPASSSLNSAAARCAPRPAPRPTPLPQHAAGGLLLGSTLAAGAVYLATKYAPRTSDTNSGSKTPRRRSTRCGGGAGPAARKLNHCKLSLQRTPVHAHLTLSCAAKGLSCL